MTRNLFKISIAVALSALVFACNKPAETSPAAAVIPVKTMVIAESETSGNKSYVGTMEESVVVSLSFPLMGTVDKVFVREGQRVRHGQLLASLNTTSAENALQVALAKQRQAQDAYDRLLQVHKEGSLPDIKLVEVETGLQQAKSLVAISKKNLDDCKLHASRDGVIAKRAVEPGVTVNTVEEAFKIVSIDPVLVKIPVPENEIGSIALGQAAHLTVPALGNRVYTGKVTVKGVEASVVSHTYDVKITINNTDGSLMPGMVCKTTLNNTKSLTKIEVPNRVIQLAPNGEKYVWVVNDSVANRQAVTTGDLTDNGIIVSSGLAVGSIIVVDGFSKLSEGAKISVLK